MNERICNNHFLSILDACMCFYSSSSNAVTISEKNRTRMPKMWVRFPPREHDIFSLIPATENLLRHSQRNWETRANVIHLIININIYFRIVKKTTLSLAIQWTSFSVQAKDKKRAQNVKCSSQFTRYAIITDKPGHNNHKRQHTTKLKLSACCWPVLYWDFFNLIHFKCTMIVIKECGRGEKRQKRSWCACILILFVR